MPPPASTPHSRAPPAGSGGAQEAAFGLMLEQGRAGLPPPQPPGHRGQSPHQHCPTDGLSSRGKRRLLPERPQQPA